MAVMRYSGQGKSEFWVEWEFGERMDGAVSYVIMAQFLRFCSIRSARYTAPEAASSGVGW